MRWKPTASMDSLRLRAKVLAAIRIFFAERDVLEVETPLLYGSTASDLHLMSFTSSYLPLMAGAKISEGRTLFLQTSPEFPMKRLLAAGSGSIYQISKAFRNGETGRLHNPEFTMLEWYRPGFNLEQLMDEMQALLSCILSTKQPERLTYAQVFQRYFLIDPHTASEAELMACVKREGLVVDAREMDRDAYLDLLMSHCIEPHLGADCPSFIFDFPASQAGLAKLRLDGDVLVAERFEVYIQGMEIANAYHELTDAKEQRARFEVDNKRRAELGLSIIPIDEHLLAAMDHGLPESAGAALGVDRLVFLAAQRSGYPVEGIADVLSFPLDRV